MPIYSSTKSAGSAASVYRSSAADTHWNSPTAVYSSNNSYAYVQCTSLIEESHWLECTNFGFSIPSTSTIAGVQVRVEISIGGWDSECDWSRLYFSLIKGGTKYGLVQSNTWYNNVSDTVYTYPSQTNYLWNTTLTPSDVNSGSFGVAIYHEGLVWRDPGSFYFYIDHVQLTVYYTVSADDSLTRSYVVSGLSPYQERTQDFKILSQSDIIKETRAWKIYGIGSTSDTRNIQIYGRGSAFQFRGFYLISESSISKNVAFSISGNSIADRALDFRIDSTGKDELQISWQLTSESSDSVHRTYQIDTTLSIYDYVYSSFELCGVDISGVSRSYRIDAVVSVEISYSVSGYIPDVTREVRLIGVKHDVIEGQWSIVGHTISSMTALFSIVGKQTIGDDPPDYDPPSPRFVPKSEGFISF